MTRRDEVVEPVTAPPAAAARAEPGPVPRAAEARAEPVPRALPRRPVMRQYELVERVKAYDPGADEEIGRASCRERV